MLPAMAQPSGGVMLAMDAPANSFPLAEPPIVVCPCRGAAALTANVCPMNRRRSNLLVSITLLPNHTQALRSFNVPERCSVFIDLPGNVRRRQPDSGRDRIGLLR